MENEIKVVSLFSGIGGFEEGLDLAKIKNRVVFASEIDAFAQKSYRANFEGSRLFGDITKINEEDIPDHELLVAGFPCQAFSIAGKRKGFEDTRGTLFYDVARILNKKKPKYILLENVKNLVSHDKENTIKEILFVLSDLGYSLDFTVINSHEAGVPQNRERTYIIGIYNGKKEKFKNDSRNQKVNHLKSALNERNFNGFNFFSELFFETDKQNIEDVILKDVDKKYYLKGKKIDSFLEKINSENVVCKEKTSKIVKEFDLPKEVHNDLERQRRVYSIKGISPTVLARSDSAKILIKDVNCFRIRKITPEENFYIQGFNKRFVKNIKKAGLSDTQMYKQSGNAVSPPVIAKILKKLNEEFIVND